MIRRRAIWVNLSMQRSVVVAKTHADTIEQEYWRSTARHYDVGCAADARLRDIP
jgi:hypothetical protein